MAQVIVLKKYKKSVLVAAYGKVAIVSEDGEVLGHEFVKGEAGMLNINVENLEEGSVIRGVKFTDEKVLTPAGIEKQKAREPLSAEDYLPFKRVVCE